MECNAGTAEASNVTVITGPDDAGAITGKAAVCAPSFGETYTVPTIPGATSYVWTVSSAGATIGSGQGTSTITVNFDGTATAGTISVYGLNSCSAGKESVFNYGLEQQVGQADPIVSESGTDQFVLGSEGVYTVPLIANATEYHWSVPAGVVIKSGDGTNSVTLSFTQAAVSGPLTVYGSNSCGKGLVSDQQFVLKVPTKTLNVYPVPSNGSFTVDITLPAEAVFNISIFDMEGNRITEVVDAKTSLGAYKKLFNLGAIPNGFYLVYIYNSSFFQTFKVVINR